MSPGFSRKAADPLRVFPGPGGPREFRAAELGPHSHLGLFPLYNKKKHRNQHRNRTHEQASLLVFGKKVHWCIFGDVSS